MKIYHKITRELLFEGKKPDLTGADLSNADLRNADLTHADLRGAILGYADLRDTDLRGVDLTGAFLFNADLRNAYLGYSDLTGADLGGADLIGADLGGADLKGAILRNAGLEDVDLTGADLSGADLGYADLKGANLANANLFGAEFFNADLTSANLFNADLTSANLYNADLTGAILTGTLLENTTTKKEEKTKYKVGDHVSYKVYGQDNKHGTISHIKDSKSFSVVEEDPCDYMPLDKITGYADRMTPLHVDPPEGKEDLLEKVQKVLKERGESHGDFKKNFNTIANLWQDYLGEKLVDGISEKDVAVMMLLLKVSRIKDGEDREDDWIDIIGYANLGGKL